MTLGGTSDTAWWTTDPSTGEPVRVLAAELVEAAQAEAVEAGVRADVLREAAARLRVMVRNLVSEGATVPTEIGDAVDWLARGEVEWVP